MNILTHFFRASMKLIQASAFTGSCDWKTGKRHARDAEICDKIAKQLHIWERADQTRNSNSKVEVLTTLGVSRAGRNRVRKYGLRKILWEERGVNHLSMSRSNSIFTSTWNPPFLKTLIHCDVLWKCAAGELIIWLNTWPPWLWQRFFLCSQTETLPSPHPGQPGTGATDTNTILLYC